MGKNKATKKAEKQEARRQGKKANNADQEIDPETAAQVKELEERLSEITWELKQVEAKMRSCTVETQRAVLTGKQLVEVPDESRVYRQVGKVFLQYQKQELTTSLQGQAALKSVEKKQLEQTKAALEQKIKSEALALRELIGPARMKKMFEEGQAKQDIVLPGDLNNAGDSVMPIFGSRTSNTNASAAAAAGGDAPADGEEKEPAAS
eukprot:TRINITY_DN63994_c0_g1_i1.p1 TRINITY_DN63994_c0_g1~~TRINITY_DN63994_c0_g1_i1.p1  ORF type:complete len:207 (-),score=75.49 TRINITY_DN63994_c0_g1_i1:25-645(-)